MKFSRESIIYLIKFLLIFLVLYYGTEGFIAITDFRGKYYVKWLDNYFNYVKWFRSFLLHSSQKLANLLGYKTYLANEYTLRIVQGNGVVLVYSCLGIGVLSFWISYVIANKGNFAFKLLWLICGLLIIVTSNIIRITVLLIAQHNKWKSPFNFNHHTVYNIIVYSIILLLIYFYMKRLRIKEQQ
jgi:exosortase/archaeosortase family protein